MTDKPLSDYFQTLLPFYTFPVWFSDRFNVFPIKLNSNFDTFNRWKLSPKTSKRNLENFLNYVSIFHLLLVSSQLKIHLKSFSTEKLLMNFIMTSAYACFMALRIVGVIKLEDMVMVLNAMVDHSAKVFLSKSLLFFIFETKDFEMNLMKFFTNW